MNEILAWGLDVIRAIQGVASPGLTAVMKGVSFLGSKYFFLAILPTIFWTVDRRRGARIAMIFLASAFVNLWLKDLLGQPRPFTLDPSVGLSFEATYGLPSAHAQGTVVFWGLMASLLPRPWGLVSAIFFPLIVGFSRVYLGVHFPTDVFMGWGLGLIFVGGDALIGHRIEGLLPTLGHRWRLILVAIGAFSMNALFRGDVSLAGVFLGAGFGFVWASEKAAFSSSGSLLEKSLRLVLGLGLTALVYVLPKLATPAEGESLYQMVHFFRYALLGVTVSFALPWLFLKLKLARPQA